MPVERDMPASNGVIGMRSVKFVLLALIGMASSAPSAYAAQSKHSRSIEGARVDTSEDANQEKGKEVKLGLDYEGVSSFVDFRRKLLADGWSPLRNMECHKAVLGDIFESLCLKSPELISCRACDIAPEIFRKTSDGYSVMRYVKGGVTLSVNVYGDINDLDDPGAYGFDVTGWSYGQSLDVLLLNDEGAL